MKNSLFFWVLFVIFLPRSNAQETIEFTSKKRVQKVSFELINNLITLPIKINDVQFRFILDSGVSTTLMFKNQNVDPFFFDQGQSFSLSGLGRDAFVNASLSKGNTIQMEGLSATNQDILIIDETNFELSQRMGTQIDGIIGYSLFKNFVVRINYSNQRLVFYQAGELPKRFLKKSKSLPLEFHRNKPFVKLEFSPEKGNNQKGYFLIDSGSSDALWLFKSEKIKVAPPVFYDFIGRGINGSIFGHRGKIHQLEFGPFSMKAVKVAYPEIASFTKLSFMKDRVGSIGGELLKRFTVIFDYKNKQLLLKPLSGLTAPFYYNMSGIEIQHSGVEMVKERLTNPMGLLINTENKTKGVEIYMRPQFRFQLRQLIEIFSIRPDSPADQAGVREGDFLLRINGKKVGQLELYEIIALLQKKPGKKLNLVIRRGTTIKTFKFRLKPLF